MLLAYNMCKSAVTAHQVDNYTSMSSIHDLSAKIGQTSSRVQIVVVQETVGRQRIPSITDKTSPKNKILRHDSINRTTLGWLH